MNRRTNLVYTVNNVVNAHWVDGVRFEDGTRLMCPINSGDTELVAQGE